MARIKQFPSKKKPVVEITPKTIKKVIEAKTIKGKFNAMGLSRGSRVDPTSKEKLILRLWNKEHAIKGQEKKNHSLKRKLIEALADHLSGETLKDSALKYGVRPGILADYKFKFLKTDSALPQFLEELFFEAAKDSVGIFHDKKHLMTAPQAAVTAGIFTERAIQLRKARTSDYKDENLPLATLQKLDSVLSRVAEIRKGKIIDVEAEVETEPKQLE